MRRRLAVVLAGSLVAAAAGLPARAAEIPGTDCNVFPDDNIWNTRVDALPIADMSDVWLRSMNAGSAALPPDFGPPSYGIPFTTVGRAHDKVDVRFAYADESDPGPYPFDARTPIEGGSDRHALIVERGTCRLYELYAARWNGGGPPAGRGARRGPAPKPPRPPAWSPAGAPG